MHPASIFILVCAVKFALCIPSAQHTVWLPAGKRVRVPCKLKNTEKVDAAFWWAELNKDLRVNSSANSVTVWYNRLGDLLHVGEILFVQVPWFEASELAVTQYVPRQTAPTEEPMSLVPEFKSWIGATNQLLEVNHLDTVTCQQLQASTVHGFTKTWNFLKRKTHIIQQTYFTFRIYVQPILIWNYAIQLDLEFTNRSGLLKTVEEWCKSQRSIAQHQTDVCSEIYEQRKSNTRLTKLTDPLPMTQSADLSYIEIGLTIDITNHPLNMFADPTNGQLSYIHARLKHNLDRYILEEIKTESVHQDSEINVMIATRLQAICPPGGHTFSPVPVLRNLQTTANNTSTNTSNANSLGSASALVDWPIICHPCPDGQAPRTAYAFDGCHYCPRGYYLGSTGWPSSAGCLACPKGFTTDRVGATGIDECVLNAGAVTRYALGYMVHLWYALQKIMVGTPGPDTQTRALGQHQKSAWAWLGKTSKTVWIWGGLYLLVVCILIALAVYRLHLYVKLHRMFRKQYRLLLKAALIGQINLVSHIKQRAKQNAMNFNPEIETNLVVKESESDSDKI